MTTIEAIDAVQMLLDELGEEYYAPIELLTALEQAQIEKAREYWLYGKKEGIRPLFRRQTLTGNGSTGISLAIALGGARAMFYEALLVKMADSETAPLHHARYISPEKYIWYRFSNPKAASRVSGRLEYSVIGGSLYHNGAGISADFSFIIQPTIPTPQSPLSLAPYTHQDIVDRAAYLLYRKEIGLDDHEAVGTSADLQLINESVKQRSELTAAKQVLRQQYKKNIENRPTTELE